MPQSRYFILLLTLPLIVLACIVLAAVPIAPGGHEHLFIGIALGTLYGQTTVAAAWTAFGPGRLIWRFPLSLLWLVLILAVFCAGSALRNQPGDIGRIMIVSQCVQWFVSQLPYWTIALVFRLHLRHRSEQGAGGPRGQFGIGQLMIITAIIGVILAIGRILVAYKFFAQSTDPEMPIFFFLLGTAIVVTLPLLCAAFLSRYATFAMLAAVIFIALVTIAEMPLLAATIGNRPGPDIVHLIWINTFTTAWVLAMVLAARWAGYQFGFADDSVGKLAE